MHMIIVYVFAGASFLAGVYADVLKLPVKYDHEVYNVFYPEDEEINLEENQYVYIRSGTGLIQIMTQLKQEDVIKERYPYPYIYKLLYDENKSIKAGEYSISYEESAEEIFAKIITGQVVFRDITVKEGQTMYDVATLLEAQGFVDSKGEFLNEAKNKNFIKGLLGEEVDSIEGYLFPNTYRITKGLSSKQLIAMMVNEFLDQYRELDSNNTTGLPRHDVVALASIIEREMKVADEKPFAASVFFNRIEKNMKFQADTTVSYGILAETGERPSRITKRDIRQTTAHNTYRMKGIPPPISNPGVESLSAVLAPKTTDYLFFVARGDGSGKHAFSLNYRKHLRAVRLYRRNIKGKKQEGESQVVQTIENEKDVPPKIVERIIIIPAEESVTQSSSVENNSN